MSIRLGHDSRVAIDQMRRRRRAIVQQRRRRRTLAGVGALALALATAGGMAALTDTDLAGAAAARALGFMDLMERRSPGARTVAQLSKTRPMQRTLAEREPEAPLLPASLVQALAPPVAPLVPVDLGPPAIPQLALFATPPASPFLAPAPDGGGTSGCCGGGGGGGGGGKGGGGGGTETTTPTIVTNIQPVPEPSTWMTMLLGFGLAGWLLRRERNAKKQFA
jgi:hypothetical protein